MKSRVLLHRLEGALLLVALATLVALFAWNGVTPILDLRVQIAETRARIDAFQRAERTAPLEKLDTSMVVANGVAPEARELAIQRMLVDQGAAIGLQTSQMSALPRRDLERGLVRLSFQLEATGDLQHWTMFMRAIAEQRPAVFVDELNLRAGPGPRADRSLGMSTTLSTYVLKPPAKS